MSAAVLATGYVPCEAEVGAGDLEQLGALAGIVQALGGPRAVQSLAVILVVFGHGRSESNNLNRLSHEMRGSSVSKVTDG
jgi:hypothetical protein